MRSIAILGANGQVGMEVSLCLSQMPGLRVIPITRMKPGSAFLERCGIECQVGSMQDVDEARRLLAPADLVVDFSLPRGLPSDIRRGMRTNIVHAIRCAPANAPYVFISSTMAFGMPSGAPRYRPYLFARTPYAADKRFGERLTRVRGLIERRPVYALRLGQVHGDLQNVSRAMLLSVGHEQGATGRQGETASDAVFCSTIALALRNLVEGKDPPGTYSLIEAPDWSRRRLHEFYAAQRGISLPPDEHPQTEPRGIGGPLRTLRGSLRHLVADGLRNLSANKDFLTAQLMPLPPAIERRLKAGHLSRRASADVHSADSAASAPQYFEGPVPGKRLRSLSDTFETMRPVRLAVGALLDARIGAASHNLDHGNGGA